MNEDEYRAFVAELLAAEKVPYREFEKVVHFEGCMPMEEMAERGVDTLRFGPMKPVGLIDPRTGSEPYAVIQLRMENRQGSMYNLVGLQTRLTHPEQRRILRMIPGLEGAEFARLGSMHRNTFINSPRLLLPSLGLKSEPRILFAGQITGVEGYVESSACGFLAGINGARIVNGVDPLVPPPETAIGSLIAHITRTEAKGFQPMNVNYGLFPELPGRVKKKERRGILAGRALDALERWKGSLQGVGHLAS
jgi:methylenetetrahydrofolate--tRNA-(uracil-5-)-methyltransferase